MNVINNMFKNKNIVASAVYLRESFQFQYIKHSASATQFIIRTDKVKKSNSASEAKKQLK